MKKTWNVVLAMWRPVLLGALGIIVITGLMGFKLADLTPGISTPELETYNSADSVKDIVDNSVNAPYISAVFLSTKLFENTFGLRLVGAVLGIITVLLFYMFAYRLHRPLVAITATAMFATSFMMLQTARLATPNIMLFSLLALMAIGYFIRFDSHHKAVWICTSIVVALSLYVPGMVIFIALGAVWQFRQVRRSFEELDTSVIATCAVLLSVLAAPIVVSLIRDPSLWRSYLGLPDQFAHWQVMAKELARGLSSLFVYAPADPIRWVGRQPALDVFAIVMFIYGIFALFKQYKLDRLWVISGIYILSIVWVAVSSNHLGIVILLPFTYILVGMGVDMLAGKWLTVFPRNPIARYIGSAFMVIAVVLSINFQIQRYFIAWPNNKETKQTFNAQLSVTDQ
jgi:4-amino-4-deoxy-L-arabinose transferase-like glycosyltransferase